MRRGHWASLAQDALHDTGREPYDDPRALVLALAAGRLRGVLSRYPLRQVFPGDPEPDAVGYTLERVADGHVIVFGGADDGRVTGQRVTRGAAEALLIGDGVPPTPSAVDRVAGWLLLGPRATLEDVFAHEHATINFLVREIQARIASTSGIFAVPYPSHAR